jgi:ADP-ribose pyrophosphatase
MAHELIEKQVIYDGKKVRLEVHHLEDDQGRRLRREVCVHPGAVVVVPLLDELTVLLIENRRYSVGEVLLELPAGTLEKHESPMNCAGRELQEETGYLAGRLQYLGKFYTSPGILTERMYVYVAYDLQRTQRALEEDEQIEVKPTAVEEALKMTMDGRIADGKTIAALLMYERAARSMGF